MCENTAQEGMRPLPTYRESARTLLMQQHDSAVREVKALQTVLAMLPAQLTPEQDEALRVLLGAE